MHHAETTNVLEPNNGWQTLGGNFGKVNLHEAVDAYLESSRAVTAFDQELRALVAWLAMNSFIQSEGDSQQHRLSFTLMS